MHGQPSDSHPSVAATAALSDSPAEPVAAGAIMGLLLGNDHHGLWHREELVCELSSSRLEVVDAIASLAGAGLVHRLDDFVMASRAARQMDQLEL
jgi:hypothetical protein